MPPARLLDPNATATADSGGLARTATRDPIEGSELIVRYLIDITGWVPDLTLQERTVNGQPGLVLHHEGTTTAILAFDMTDGRIPHIWALRNPDKLRPWTTG
jgi:RNA polymerase sigma-70 factor (ECF subfamily)